MEYCDLERYKKEQIEKAQKTTSAIIGAGSGLLAYQNTQNTNTSVLVGLAVGVGAMISYKKGLFSGYFENYANHKTNQFKKAQKENLKKEVSNLIVAQRNKNNLTTQVNELNTELDKLNYDDLCLLHKELLAQSQKSQLLAVIQNNKILMEFLKIKDNGNTQY